MIIIINHILLNCDWKMIAPNFQELNRFCAKSARLYRNGW